MRLLWAEALDENRSAIVIEVQGQILGGVAFVRHLDFHVDFGRFRDMPLANTERATLNLSMIFEWYDTVPSADVFRRSTKWRQELVNRKQIAAPK